MADGAFWAFSNAFYTQPGVSAALIRCQDEAGADVNLLLFALWHAREGAALDDAALATAEALVAPWRTGAIAPLRAARRAMKQEALAGFGGGELRARVAAAELEAERLAQAAMERLHAPAEAAGDVAASARENLAAYGRALGLALPADAVATLVAALTAWHGAATT
jgi:uncharacterized protein (TIGR02444 family)